MTWLIGVFIILHGLVHAWYVVLSFNLVNFQPDMGWTGKSWLLTPLFGAQTAKSIAGWLFAIAGFGFLLAGVIFLSNNESWPPLMLGSAIFSAIVIIMFWDGKFSMLIQTSSLGVGRT